MKARISPTFLTRRMGEQNWARMGRTAFLLVIALCLGAPAILHSQEVIVRTTGGLDNTVVSRHQLTVVRCDARRSICLVRVPSGTDVSAVLASLRSEISIVNAELDNKLALPAVVTLNQSTVSVLSDTPVTDIATVNGDVATLNQSTVSVLDQSTVSVLDALLTLTPTSFFGTTVSAGMLAQPAMQIIENNAAHQVATGAGIVIADINNGVDTTHPGLTNVLTAGVDFTGTDLTSDVSVFSGLDQSTVSILNETTNLADSMIGVLNQSTVSVLDGQALSTENNMPPDWGHGTEVAGILHLTAPQARIMPLKAFTASGTGRLFDVIEAIYYATDNGAQVINMSFGCACQSQELSNAIAYAAARNVILTASTGNDGTQTAAYPASYPQVMGVAATNFDDTRASFSNYGGANSFVSAPGAGIITLFPGYKYAAVWGTSFAAPMVAGESALLLQQGVPPSTVSQQIAKSAANINKLNAGTYIGRGRIDLSNALQH